MFRFKLKTKVWFSCCCKCQSVIPPWPCLRKAAAVYLPSSIARCAGLVSVDGFPVALINDVIGIEINGLINRQLPRQLRHMFTRLSVQKCLCPLHLSTLAFVLLVSTANIDTTTVLHYLIAMGDPTFLQEVTARVQRDDSFATRTGAQPGAYIIKELLELKSLSQS